MLAEYIDGTLGPRERAEVEAHLAQCAECYEAFADVARAATEPRASADSSAAPPSAARRPATFVTRWVPLAAAALVTIAAGAWWWSPGARLGRAEAQLASAAAASHRLSPGRLSIDATWAAAATASRGEGDRIPADVRAAAATLERLAADAADARARHARALALLAAGDAPAAIGELRRTIDDYGATAPRRNDLAAALLDAALTDGRTEQVAAALHEASLATTLEPGYLPGWFTRAIAAEALGPNDLAAAAWRDYLARDANSLWSAEARERLSRLERSPGGDARTQALHDAERTALPAWQAARANAEPSASLSEARRRLQSATNDRELLALIDATGSPVGATRDAVAAAITARTAWMSAYERGDSETAARAADAEAAALRTAELWTGAADARRLLVGDRNAAYERIPALARELERRGYVRAASLLFISRGSTSLRRRAWSAALDDYRAGLRLAEAGGDRELGATAHAMLADAYRDLGDMTTAWSELRVALDALPSVVNSRLAYSVLRAAVDAAHEAELPGAAIEWSQALAARMRAAQSPTPELLAHLDRAAALQEIGDDTAAAEAIETARGLLADVRDPSLHEECAAELALTAGRLQAQTDAAGAVPQLTRTLTTFEGQQTVSRIAQVLLIRGTAHQRLGHTAEAERDWERGVALVADDDERIRDQQLRISRRDAVWTLFSALTAARLDRPVQALETTERARARQLLDSLAPTQRADHLEGEALWNWIPEGATALVYAALPDELAIWRLNRQGLQLTRRPLKERDLERRVDDVLAEMRAGAPGAAAARLAADVLAPLAGGVPGPLLIVPDGALHRVPFAALPTAEGRLLVFDWTSTIAPSLSAARAVAPQPAGAGGVVLAGYGAPRAGESLRALPGVNRELDALRAIYPDALELRNDDATPARLAVAASRGRIVHIAAHGVANALRPSASRFELAGGADDHEWRPEDIAPLALTRHPVVVLSGCDTATGRVFRGEGPMSLARPFLAAGSAAVIGTLWTLDDALGPDVTVAIHRELQRGAGASEAVASAQRAAISAGLPARVWAAFAVMGGIGRERAN
jgi:CHAT domain-containing protein